MDIGPATRRWLVEEMGIDRRRAYDARKREEGLKRVSVMVPTQFADALKTFARLLRNANPDTIAHYRADLEQYMEDTWRDYDEAVASGEFDPDADD